MHSILVEDYMDRDPHAIINTATVRDVVAILMKAKITGAPVVDEDKTLVGFVSEQDCIREMLNDTFYCEESPSVTEVMKTEVITCTPDTSIVELAEKMSKSPPKNYPVCKDGKLIGLFSRHFLLKALLENNEDCYIHS
ncbi:MAG: CBS domain-containing protein [Agarilytica sp.]